MKTAVITGGTRGIGAALVRSFLTAGWHVVYSGKSEESVNRSLMSLREGYPEAKFTAVRCDVTSHDDLTALWNEAVKTSGGVDIWVNNAGTASDQAPFHKIDPAVFTTIIDTNVKGLMLATHLAYNRMLEQGYGAIYNMEGLGSDGRTVTGMTPYGTSKRAVRYFTDAFADEVNNGPVVIGTISPGMVLTDLTIGPLKRNPENSARVKKIYNILANEPDTVAPFLVRKMMGNTKHGARISYLTGGKILSRFLLAPFSRRDIVSKYL